MEIILLRHGKPEAIPMHAIASIQMSNWISKYNTSGLSTNSQPTPDCMTAGERCNVIVSSDLQRSIDSAQSINPVKHKIANSLYAEAGLPYLEGKNLKLSPKYWVVIFRLLWFLGYSNQSESRIEARHRAKEATRNLIGLAETHQSILFAGHGLFNRYIAKELKALGWSGPQNPGSKYWQFEVYFKD